MRSKEEKGESRRMAQRRESQIQTQSGGGSVSRRCSHAVHRSHCSSYSRSCDRTLQPSVVARRVAQTSAPIDS